MGVSRCPLRPLLPVFDLLQRELNEMGRDQWHVAGEEDDGLGLARFEGGVNAAQGTALGDAVASDNPHGETSRLRGLSNVAQHRGVAEAQA